MKLNINRYTLQIIPEDETYPVSDKRDTAFIESVLGLKNEGDSIRLARKNVRGLLCLACLETEQE